MGVVSIDIYSCKQIPIELIYFCFLFASLKLPLQLLSWLTFWHERNAIIEKANSISMVTLSVFLVQLKKSSKKVQCNLFLRKIQLKCISLKKINYNRWLSICRLLAREILNECFLFYFTNNLYWVLWSITFADTYTGGECRAMKFLTATSRLAHRWRKCLTFHFFEVKQNT